MQSISYNTAQQEKLIRFMSPGSFFATENAFYIADGDRITITSGYDGKVSSHVCKYLDPYHFEVSNSVFHMDQFSEVMGRNGNIYEPEKPLTDLNLYNRIYCDRSLVDESGNRIPYHEIICQCDAHDREKYLLRIAVCPDADGLRTACIIRSENDRYDQEFLSLSSLRQRLYSNLWDTLNRWDRKALDAVLTDILQKQMHVGLEQQIDSARQHVQTPETHDSLSSDELRR